MDDKQLFAFYIRYCKENGLNKNKYETLRDFLKTFKSIQWLLK